MSVVSPFRHRPFLRALGVTLVGAATAQAQSSGPVSLRAFADVSYLASQRPGVQGFRTGQAALHANATLSDRLAFFGEVTATALAAGGYGLEIERAFLRYDVRDWLKLSAGRFHTPIGFWNTAYHHGTWLQSPAVRPEVVRPTGFVPLHFVGALAEGALPAGPATLRYVAGVGNGRGATPTRAGDAGDVNLSRAWTVAASVAPTTVPHLRVGGSLYGDVIAAGTTRLDERIAAGYLAWDAEPRELIAEYVRTTHAPRAGATGEARASEGYYLQVAHRLPGALRTLKPYARAERVRPAAGDALYEPLRLRYDAALGGVRADVAPTAALKLEYRRERFAEPRWFHAALLQLSFTFPGHGSAHAAHDGTDDARGH